MSLLDWLASGVIVAGIIYFYTYTKKKEAARVIPLEKDAAKRAEWAAQQRQNELEIQRAIDEFKAKKAKYEQLKKELQTNDKTRNNETTTSSNTNNSGADLYILKGRSTNGDEDGVS